MAEREAVEPLDETEVEVELEAPEPEAADPAGEAGEGTAQPELAEPTPGKPVPEAAENTAQAEPAEPMPGDEPGEPELEPAEDSPRSEPGEPTEPGAAEQPSEAAAGGEEPASPAPPPEPAAEQPTADTSEMESVIEAVLFVAAEPVSRGRLLDLFDEADREPASRALEAVLARYDGGDGRGVMAEEVAGGIRLVTRPELVGWLRRFFEVSGGSKLSMAALETLAIVAYRQPITGPEIQELRSVNSSGVLSTLLQRRLVRIAGRKEVVGKPFLYATTREFLVHFGLKSLKDLPPLEEFEETFGEGDAASGLGGVAAILGEGAGLGEDREERILQEVAAMEEAEDRSGSEAEAASPRVDREPARSSAGEEPEEALTGAPGAADWAGEAESEEP